MSVTKEQLKAILEQPKSAREIAEAKRREALIRFYGKAALDASESQYALSDFLDVFLKEVVTNYDQHNLYKLMLQFPIDTAPLMSECYGALWKIFDGKDPVYDAEFVSENSEEDWEDYRSNWELDRFWNYVAWQEFKYYPESFVVVDISENQTTNLPEPYPYFLRIANVLDYSKKQNPGEWDELDYIVFRIDKTKIAYFDTVSYQVFSTKENSTELEAELVNNAHNLGICPATKLMHCEHPVSLYITSLKKLLFAYLGRDIIDFSIANPVWWVYEQDCNFEDPQTHNVCDGGFLRGSNGDYILSNGKLHKCPKCQGRFRGHGTVLEIPIPEEGKALGTPAGAITTPVDSLEHGSTRVKEREDEVYYGLVGYGSETPNDKAVNKQQVRALQESTEDKLRHLQTTFERVQQWTESLMCKLRYGTSLFNSLSVSYGQTHYIESAETVLEQYQDAKTKGASDVILDGIYENYILVRYKNNPEKMHENKILWHLEPFHHKSNSEVREMYRNFECNFEDYYIKINFSSLIARFELENISITEFGSNLTFAGQIEAIYKVLQSYAESVRTTTEARKAAVQPPGTGGGNPTFAAA